MRAQEENMNQILEARKPKVNFRFGLDNTEYLIIDFGFGSTKTKFSKIWPNHMADFLLSVSFEEKSILVLFMNLAELFCFLCSLGP